MINYFRHALLLAMGVVCCHYAGAQSADEDIWKEINLHEVDYQKSKNYCVRLFGYYRFIDDGTMFTKGRQHKLYRVSEGISYIDVRYSKEADDGGQTLVSRNLVHPDKSGDMMDFYELKPYTFLEKARRLPKYYTIDERGESTSVFTKGKLAGTVTRNRARQELRMEYNALAPDTMFRFNILLVSGKLKNIMADAVYRLDDSGVDYVPQGNLKQVVFDGDVDMNIMGTREVFHEHTVFCVDSVVYMTRDEYKADKRLSNKERRRLAGYTAKDIDRLKAKYGVRALSQEVLRRIEDQRDWDDAYEQWLQTR
ncbi:MAG: hypothetical protein K5683_08540 [Prevotella sp.]|nr:hypothetical protein [Prevotella sp.]